MLSVLIPTYNYDCRKLITSIQSQCAECCSEYELLVYDDGSRSNISALLNNIQLPCTKIKLLKNNIGRAAIRNMLAKEAKGDWLLFIDCDAQIISQQFISNYLNHLQDGMVIVGGTAYAPTPPNNEYRLRWTYGIKREGNNNYRKNFTTFNFCIQRHLFQQIRFDETLKQYGHEDTVFQIELERDKIPVININNPLLHCGLDTNSDYLQKLRISNRNLLTLYYSGEYPELKQHSALLRQYIKAEQYHYITLIKITYKLVRKLIIHNLNGTNPNLTALDIYKLGELCSVSDYH